MSQKETWRTRKYWSEIGGLLIEEFIAVEGSKTTGKRFIDGVIVLNENRGIHPNNFYEIKGKDVISIQTKKGRLGMYLLGQAFFSQFLIERFKPKSVKSVAICGKDDEILNELAKRHNIEVVVIHDNEYDAKYDAPSYLEKNGALHK